MPEPADYFVVMGARVMPGGRPSGSLRRRIEDALARARHSSNPRFLPTGGVGAEPPAEAEVVRSWLVRAGVSPDRVVVEAVSHDTLSSVRHCAALLREADDVGSVTVCTDCYHVARCVVLFRILGVRARPGGAASAGALGRRRLAYYWLRDLVALCWDVPQAVALRVARRR